MLLLYRCSALPTEQKKESLTPTPADRQSRKDCLDSRRFLSSSRLLVEDSPSYFRRVRAWTSEFFSFIFVHKRPLECERTAAKEVSSKVCVRTMSTRDLQNERGEKVVDLATWNTSTASEASKEYIYASHAWRGPSIHVRMQPQALHEGLFQ